MTDEIRFIQVGDKKIKWDDLKEGFKNEGIKNNEKLNTIFAKFDSYGLKQGDGTLDANELAGLKGSINEFKIDGKSILDDNNITEEEAEAFLKKTFGNDTELKASDLFDFMLELGKASNAVVEEAPAAAAGTPPVQPEGDKDKKEVATEDMGNDDVAPTFDFSKGKLTGVTIDASAAGIAKKAYTGEVRLPKGTEAPTDGSMPKVLLMTLPASYNGGVTRLTYDEESGMYLSRNKDMKFELKLGDGGKVTLTAVKDDALAKLRSENLQKWQGVKEQKESQRAEQAQQEEKQQREEVVSQKTEDGKKLAKEIKDQLKHDWSPKDARAKLKTINKDNAAYIVYGFREGKKESEADSFAAAIDNVMGLDNEDVIKYILNPLIERAKELNITPKEVNGDEINLNNPEKLSIKDLNRIMNRIADAIIQHEIDNGAE